MRECNRVKKPELELRQRRKRVISEKRVIAEQEARRERAEAELRHERAALHEHELIEEHEREEFAGTSAVSQSHDESRARNGQRDRTSAY